jgi:hypothetical protein
MAIRVIGVIRDTGHCGSRPFALLSRRMSLPRKASRLVIPPWLCFLAFGVFVCFVTPLGEGFDEPLHFDYVQRIAQLRDVPMGNSYNVSSEITQFLEGHPVSWALHERYPFLLTYEQYWEQTDQLESRDRRVRALRFEGAYTEGLSKASRQYESHQPPLYYLLVAPAFGVFSKAFFFVDTFMALRLLNVLLASVMVPGAFFLAKAVLGDDSAAANVARLVVFFPGLYPGVIRVSNDAVSAVIVTWMLFLLVSFLRKPETRYLYGLCALLIAGLWTKAFFIPIAAGVIAVMLGSRRFRASAIVLTACALGLPWYVRTFMITGSLTGLPETLEAGSSVISSVQALSGTDWRNAFNVAVSTHIWTGNWSFLGVRSWMYRVVAWSAFAGILGLLRKPMQIPYLPALAAIYAVFAAGLAYYATQVFQASGLSVIQGWYLASFIPLEAVFFVAGLRTLFPKRWHIPVLLMQTFLLALLVYSELFVAMPYYAGLTSHQADGHLATYHASLGDFALGSVRLWRLHPWVPAFLPWLLIGGVVAYGMYSIGSAVLRSRLGPGYPP